MFLQFDGMAYRLTMADLDEALFLIAGLLDFAAALAREGGRDRLHIGAVVAVGTGQAIASVVRRQLDTVPSIRSAQEAGRLDVCVDVQSVDWRSTPGFHMSKRRIVDQRGF